MPRSLCLTRQCLGLITRIECLIRPVPGDEDVWMLMFAAGMSGEQPSAIRSQGPFNGLPAAQSMLTSIAESLTLGGYQTADDVPIWTLHMQAELRRINRGVSSYQRSSPF
ncbi:hypothetical protein BZK31_03125 [Pseudomonas floridensis]|uniref:Uncharacterized protein n=1 Tax=Pseudomonas floridensis TaxID=1958950 RepID=A0A1X0NC02_9PSED|nr:hypothetical protein [Pseudomonas floridensis]ORC61580.1 hypothetical protein BZK31_03125 [Pseudomonas floridensis]